MFRIAFKCTAAMVTLLTIASGCSKATDANVGYPTKTITIMAPASAGGGYDGLARALQSTLSASGASHGRTVEVTNVPGAGGITGLSQFSADASADPHRFMIMGLTLVGSIQGARSTTTFDGVTPIATLTADYDAIAVPANSKYQSMKDLITDFRAKPGDFKVGGGPKFGTDHILALLMAQYIGVKSAEMKYAEYSGGEVIKNLLNGSVSFAVSGVNDFKADVAAGKVRLLAVSSPTRLPGLDVPTLTESDVNVVLSNWRGIVAPAGISSGDLSAILDMINMMHDSPQWQEVLTSKGWSDLYLTGGDFAKFLAVEQARVSTVLSGIA